MYGEDAKAIAEAYEKKAARAAQYAAANKPTDMRNYVRDVELAAKGDPQAQIRVDAANAYIGAQRAAQLANAQTAAGKAETTLRDKARANINDTLSNFNHPTAKRVSELVRQDKANAKAGNPTTLADDYLQSQYEKEEKRLAPSTASAAPAAAPAASAAPASASAPPSIASIDGAPRGATIGAQTSRGWEVKDRSGKVIGYAQ
jgi:hypothetical protein